MRSLSRSLLFLLFIGAATASSETVADILIKGGTVVTTAGKQRADIRIRGEQIVEVGLLDAASDNERVIDASGLLILPGGIDPHVHLAPATAAFPFADDFESGSRAALAGGITTVGHMAFPMAGELPLDTLSRERQLAETQTIADVFIHTTVLDPSDTAIAQLPELVKIGQPSIKVFMPFSSFETRFPDFMQLLTSAGLAGLRVAVHCEDAHTLEYQTQALVRAGKTSFEYYNQSRSIISEVVATQRAIAMAETTGASIYIVHLGAARALEAAKAARVSLPVAIETRPLYLHFTQDVYQGDNSGLYVGMPPIRGSSDRDALWAGIKDGSIDTVATDHAPWTRDQKLAEDHTIASPRPGVNNLQFMLPMLFSEGVVQGRISLERFVAVTSENAAKLFGLYPRKGAVLPGSDADLIVWDAKRKRTINDTDTFSKAGFSIYKGTEVTGWPIMTIRRGEIVFEQGKIRGARASGRLIPRKPLAASLPK